MKEIKFKAWNNNSKEMLEVIQINFRDKYLEYSDINSENGVRRILLKEVELLQFTGLQDKNGVDIYEGDIIELWYEMCSGEYREYSDKGIVFFENGIFKIKCIDEQHEYDFDFLHHVDDSTKEVIGNIYENPELLEDDNNE